MPSAMYHKGEVIDSVHKDCHRQYHKEMSSAALQEMSSTVLLKDVIHGVTRRCHQQSHSPFFVAMFPASYQV